MKAVIKRIDRTSEHTQRVLDDLNSQLPQTDWMINFLKEGNK